MNRAIAAAQERIAANTERMQALNALAGDEGRDFADDEKDEWESLEASNTASTKVIEREKKIIGMQATDNPLMRGTARIETANKAKKFSSLGEQLRAIRLASDPSVRRIDPRLVSFDPSQEIGAYGSGMNEQNPTDGGFLLQPEYASDLLRVAFKTGQLAKLVRRRPIGANSNQLKINALDDANRTNGNRYGAMQLYWLEEGGLKLGSQPKLRPIVYTLKKLIGLMYATDELLQDATALEAMTRDVFGQEFGFVIDDAVFRGTGAGQPQGFYNSPAKIVIAAEGGQTATTINFKNILNMYTAFASQSKMSTSARWIVSNLVPAQLMQMTLGGTSSVFGFPVYLPPNAAQGRPLAELMGIPILEVEQAEPLGTQGDISLVDFDQYLMIDKAAPGSTTLGDGELPIEAASSIHVRFIYDETTFRFVYRCDGGCWWNSAITQYRDATNKMSPIITLAAR